MTIPASEVVFLEHVGPYWTVGRKAAQTRAYMDSRGITGPVFVRYPQAPRRRTARDTKCEIGFVIESPHAPDPPFQLGRRPEETVAVLTVLGRLPDAEHDYANLYSWIRDRGYAAAGPIAELYYPADSLREAVSAKAEIRFTLTPPPARSGDQPVAGTDAALGVDPAPADGRPPKAAPRLADPVDVPAEPVAVAAPASSEAGMLPERRPGADDDAPVPDSIASSGSDASLPAAASETSLAQHPIPPAPTVAAADERPVTPRPQAPRPATVLALLAERRYASAAEAILPAVLPSAAGDRAWLHQVILRIEATARAIARLDSADASMAASLGTLAEAIETRYAALGPGSVPGLPDPPTASPGPEPDRRTAAKRALTDSLDALIGRIASRGVSAPDAREELYRVLAVLQELRPIIEPKSHPTDGP